MVTEKRGNASWHACFDTLSKTLRNRVAIALEAVERDGVVQAVRPRDPLMLPSPQAMQQNPVNQGALRGVL